MKVVVNQLDKNSYTNYYKSAYCLSDNTRLPFRRMFLQNARISHPTVNEENKSD